MASRTSPPDDHESRALHKRWLTTWRDVGPVLQAERWQRLAAMTDDDARRATRWVLELWQPGWRGDDGEGLILQQRVFAGRSQSGP